jgi:hypothetical protein
MAKPSKQEKLDTIIAEIDEVRKFISYLEVRGDMYSSQRATCHSAVNALQSAVDVLRLMMEEAEDDKA